MGRGPCIYNADCSAGRSLSWSNYLCCFKGRKEECRNPSCPGSKKTQIAALLSVRILVSGGIGIALGSSVFLLLRELEKKIVYVEDASKEYAGVVSVLLIPVLGILILLVMQLPAIFALLKETPAEQKDERTYTGESLISYKNRRIFKVKHPIWWYSGLEDRRFRGVQCGFSGGTSGNGGCRVSGRTARCAFADIG